MTGSAGPPARARPLRVLHVLAETGWSGGELQLDYLLRHLCRQGHANAIVLPPGAKFAGAAQALGVPVHEANLRRPLRPRTARDLRQAVRAVRPDVLHFGCGRSLLWGGLFALGLRVPLRVTTRRIDYAIGFVRGLRYRRLVDHVVANCDAVRRVVLAAGVPVERVTTVHEGIDVEAFRAEPERRAAARARLGLPADAVVLGCAATLRPRKGQRLLVAAFARLAQPQARLVLAGTGSDAGPLARLVQRLGLEGRVLLPGRVAPVQDLYAACDVFCMTSRNEGLANACLEASAAGLPLVVTAAGGLPEIVADGETGAVVPIGDQAALTAALARYVADAALRQRHGAAGAARTARCFGERLMAEKTEALWRDLLAPTDVATT